MNQNQNQTEQNFEHLLRVGAAAQFLGLKVKTLQAWRHQGKGPPFLRFSRKAVRYRRQDLITWAEQHIAENKTENQNEK